MAFDISNDYVACRFLSVDADIENNPDSPDFYEANGFIRMTDKKYTKKTKIVCMYKDILPAEQLEFLLFLCIARVMGAIDFVYSQRAGVAMNYSTMDMIILLL